MAGKIVVRSKTGAALAQEITAGRHNLVADEPVYAGGDDSGPDPYALLMAALGSCTAMTMKMYAARRNWPLESSEIHLSHRKENGVDKFSREIVLKGPLSAEQRARLIEIANKCPVHKTLEGSGSVIETKDITGSPPTAPKPSL